LKRDEIPNLLKKKKGINKIYCCHFSESRVTGITSSRYYTIPRIVSTYAVIEEKERELTPGERRKV